MRRSWRGAQVGAIAAALLIAGASVAAVTAGGEGTRRSSARAAKRSHPVPLRDVVLAARYLGMPPAQVALALHSGKSLEQVASEHGAGAQAGLIEALVAAKRERLNALSAGLVRQVRAEVKRSGTGAATARAAAPIGQTPRLGLFAGRHRLALVAAHYLGLSPAALRAEIRAGRSLGELADAGGGGRSAAGLKDVLLGAARARLATATSAGRVTRAQAAAIGAGLERRLAVFVKRRRHAH